MNADRGGAGAGRPRLAPAGAVFTRFFFFGLLRAWGGPVAQIPGLREEFAGEGDGKFASRERFDRALALYQALPGPEATEMCVWLGMQARGRLGGLLAGLGFILPGLALVIAGAWLYGRVGAHESGGAGSAWLGVLSGMQAAVAAMLVRAVHKLGAGVLKDGWLWAIAFAAAVAQAAGIVFWVSLVAGAAGGALARTVAWKLAPMVIAAVAALGAWTLATTPAPAARHETTGAMFERGAATTGELLASGLRGGSLTFGGAFSLVPILHHDSVERGRWVTEGEFLDAIAVTGVLPAPMVMFGTFIAMLVGGVPGALVMTLGLFLPAFAITLLGHGIMERAVERRGLHAALDGVTSAVVGIMAASAAWLVMASVKSVAGAAVFVMALVILYAWKSRWATPIAIALGAVAGAALLR